MSFNYDDDFGLENLGEISLHEPDWSFDLLSVWVDPGTGVFYGATTSGCSCPSPYEEYESLADLEKLGTNPHKAADWVRNAGSQDDRPDDLISRIMNWKKENNND